MGVHHIPIEMIGCILLKLKVKALIRSQSVCKEWCSLIQDPHFKLSYRGRRRVLEVGSGLSLAITAITDTLLIKTLLFRLSMDSFSFLNTKFLPLHLWGTCNGLVLFSVREHILLWNPSIRCCCTKVLELPHLLNNVPRHFVVSGLCYLPSTGDYKVVLFLLRDGIVHVASLKNKDWRQVLFPYNPVSIRDVRDDGVNFRNTLHWRVSDSLEQRWNRIVYFDPERDEFKELPTPEGESVIRGMGIMDDCLCLARQGKEEGEIEVLVMKEYGVKKSWISVFVISVTKFKGAFNYGYGYRNITFYSSKCNTKVLICSCFFSSLEILVYDVKNKTLNIFLGRHGGNGVPVRICSYIQSIVSPHEFIWRDDEHKLSKNDAVLRFILERFNSL